jgi:hypothetical protein
MARRRRTLPPELAEALDLIEKGHLFALQEWIKSGDPLRVPEDPEMGEHLLLAAAQTGFHSVVTELLKASEWSQIALASALEIAFEKHRHDLAQLLLDHGAPIARVNFSTICATLFFDHMELFLRQGGNPSHENQFEDALQNYALRPLLKFFLTFRAEFPALEDQAALALYRAVEKGHPGKTALLAWAGADPFRLVPWERDGAFPVPSALDGSTAANIAVLKDNAEVLKALRLKPTPSQAVSLLDLVRYTNPDLFTDLLKTMPREHINDTPRGSCSALEHIVAHCRPRTMWSTTTIPGVEAEDLRRVKLLIEAGARWNAPPDQLRSHRRALLEHEDAYIVELLRLLLSVPNAVEMDTFLEFCRSQRLEDSVRITDESFADELARLRHSQSHPADAR